uniref:Uncharacterized protein n=1 Tax=Haptolina brevifila TaxID=156173 RepID=A0A7S2NN09_9EUKA|mmetsp:Transcript_82702/g.165034  ORF Transcript_82702/g.165034 Transcript_82702/m.165034 type:complete len:120 (+) Transcript_82702:195-554(+)
MSERQDTTRQALPLAALLFPTLSWPPRPPSSLLLSPPRCYSPLLAASLPCSLLLSSSLLPSPPLCPTEWKQLRDINTPCLPLRGQWSTSSAHQSQRPWCIVHTLTFHITVTESLALRAT